MGVSLKICTALLLQLFAGTALSQTSPGATFCWNKLIGCGGLNDYINCCATQLSSVECISEGVIANRPQDPYVYSSKQIAFAQPQQVGSVYYTHNCLCSRDMVDSFGVPYLAGMGSIEGTDASPLEASITGSPLLWYSPEDLIRCAIFIPMDTSSYSEISFRVTPGIQIDSTVPIEVFFVLKSGATQTLSLYPDLPSLFTFTEKVAKFMLANTDKFNLVMEYKAKVPFTYSPTSFQSTSLYCANQAIVGTPGTPPVLIHEAKSYDLVGNATLHSFEIALSNIDFLVAYRAHVKQLKLYKSLLPDAVGKLNPTTE